MRRNINMAIVFISTILAGVFMFFNIAGVLPFVALMIAFNIISLIFYHESRLIIAYHIVSIFLILGFFVTSYGLVMDSEIYLLFRSFVDVGGFAIFFISFGIILQNKTKLSLERLLMIVTVYNLVFYTSNRATILGYAIGFFRTTEVNSVEHIILVFNIVNFAVMGLIAFVQVFLIYKFDNRLSKQEYLEKRRLQRIEDIFY